MTNEYKPNTLPPTTRQEAFDKLMKMTPKRRAQVVLELKLRQEKAARQEARKKAAAMPQPVKAATGTVDKNQSAAV
jgi:hypothetical protein